MINDVFGTWGPAQRSLNKKLDLNYEYGEQSETFCDNRINVVKNYVCEEMNKFIFNEDNVFELICIDKKSGRTRSKIYTLNQLQ